MSNKPINIKIDPSRHRVIAEAVVELRKRGWCVLTYSEGFNDDYEHRRNLRSEHNE